MFVPQIMSKPRSSRKRGFDETERGKVLLQSQGHGHESCAEDPCKTVVERGAGFAKLFTQLLDRLGERRVGHEVDDEPQRHEHCPLHGHARHDEAPARTNDGADRQRDHPGCPFDAVVQQLEEEPATYYEKADEEQEQDAPIL